MEHRKFPNSFRMLTDQGQDRNHSTAEQPQSHMGRAVAPENGSLVYPDNITRAGVHFSSQWNSESRGNEYPSSSFSTIMPHLQPCFPGPSYDPFPQSSAAGNLYQAPLSNAGHAYSNYYPRHNIHETQSGLLDSVTGSGRGPYKRKSPSLSLACERGSTSRFFSVGSSSSSSEFPLEKPASDFQPVPPGHIGLPHYGVGSLSIAGEDSVRNVRSRSRLDLEVNPIRTHLSSHSSYHYHSSSYRGAADLTNINADETPQRLNFNALPPPAHEMIQISGTNGLSHESNQFLARGSGTEISGCHFDYVSSRNLLPSSQYVQAPPIQGAMEGRSSHSQRAIPSYRAGLSYPRSGHESSSTQNGLQLFSETHSSRYSRSSAGGWPNSHRNGRPRIAFERFQSISSIVDAHNRMGSQDVVVMDQSSLYANSRNLFDQYGEMRLDVDNMGYEELLALGERIGNVNTGLSQDMISKCLMETKNSSDQNNEEGTCCICLEEYSNGEEFGTLKNCGHNYHVGCIKKWLLMKNACPICKAPALKETSKEE